ncbi:flagellar biosynthesis protein FlhF [Sporosarcina sp. JAI121]|uniref:flagellar biosynthesis protein FlhF n=1 Tax=Sporosarcina sp. JAI121 TaxID=2723064 RepID=UPI0015CC5EA8|nr:flagellar biosynthesis protein FlhF [Sporosarcina sp. JAI121]NYF24247.1 flagellar biosynthesis protein FlhF [Sporosarcina sp. JAI121]
MKMKKYTAETMVEAMKKVRLDFGDDAIILSSNVVKSKGYLGFFKKKSVEVVAGFDEPFAKVEEAVPPLLSSQPTRDDSISVEMKKEMTEMKKLLKDMQQASIHSQFPDEMKPLLTHLHNQGLSEKSITQIGESLFKRMKGERKEFTAEEQQLMTRQFLEQEMANLPFGGISFNKKYVNVLGPTGVGKTTTIAKIAARALLEKKKKIGFITTDTYRIAAIEQLRTYANLLQAPVEVAYNKRDFEKAIEKLKDLDLIFIDTAGRNYKEAKFVEDLTQLIDFSLEMESYLVLSMTSKEADMRTIVDQFNKFPIEKFIFTKMDETGSIGPLFNLMKDYGIGTAYYTDGQEVPEDITEADRMKLITLLLKGAPDA